jgi:hypothetical protein
MNSLVSVLGLEALLEKHGIRGPFENFEAVYASLCSDPEHADVRAELEDQVYAYFSRLALPDEPTLYDHLILSLRGKDVIFTFNWDPLLSHAYGRNKEVLGAAHVPSIWFLHGSVAAAKCAKHPRSVGTPKTRCPDCGELLVRSSLLFPIEQKDYTADRFIADEWEAIDAALREAFAFTVFGYSAPTSDVDAIRILRAAWTSNRLRDLVETEIIDIKTDAELDATWRPFVFSHHRTFWRALYDSSIGGNPRRTCEAFAKRLVDGKWVHPDPLPRGGSFPELYGWLEPFLEAEGVVDGPG